MPPFYGTLGFQVSDVSWFLSGSSEVADLLSKGIAKAYGVDQEHVIVLEVSAARRRLELARPEAFLVGASPRRLASGAIVVKYGIAGGLLTPEAAGSIAVETLQSSLTQVFEAVGIDITVRCAAVVGEQGCAASLKPREAEVDPEEPEDDDDDDKWMRVFVGVGGGLTALIVGYMAFSQFRRSRQAKKAAEAAQEDARDPPLFQGRKERSPAVEQVQPEQVDRSTSMSQDFTDFAMGTNRVGNKEPTIVEDPPTPPTALRAARSPAPSQDATQMRSSPPGSRPKQHPRGFRQEESETESETESGSDNDKHPKFTPRRIGQPGTLGRWSPWTDTKRTNLCSGCAALDEDSRPVGERVTLSPRDVPEDALAKWVKKVYARYNPSKLDRVDQLVKDYKDQEATLVEMITEKYRLHPSYYPRYLQRSTQLLACGACSVGGFEDPPQAPPGCKQCGQPLGEWTSISPATVAEIPWLTGAHSPGETRPQPSPLKLPVASKPNKRLGSS